MSSPKETSFIFPKAIQSHSIRIIKYDTSVVQIMNRVLITGGAGFIGSSLVSALLLSKNYQITVLDNLSTGRKKNISRWLASPNIEFVQADLLDNSSGSNLEKSSALQRAVDNSDIIFHMAANPSVAEGAKNTGIDFQQNVLATYNLLEAIRISQIAHGQNYKGKSKTKKRKKILIFTSSSTIYGEANKRPTPEDYSPLHPISLYGATKLACEAMISGYSHMFNIPSVIARLANIIGPLNTHGVLYDFIAKLSSHNNYLDILGNGKQAKSYLYIEDCISALMLMMKRMLKNPDRGVEDADEDENNKKNLLIKSDINGNVRRHRHQHQYEVFNVGSDDTISVLQIADLVINQLLLDRNKVQKIFINELGDGRGWKGDVTQFLLDCSKLRDAGWNPKNSSSRGAVINAINQYTQVKSKSSS
jgi:UDP-glucose 4-epimerase